MSNVTIWRIFFGSLISNVKLLDNLKVSHRCLKYFDFHFISTFCLARSRYTHAFFNDLDINRVLFLQKKTSWYDEVFLQLNCFHKNIFIDYEYFLVFDPFICGFKICRFQFQKYKFLFLWKLFKLFLHKIGFYFSQIHIFCSKISALAQFYLS